MYCVTTGISLFHRHRFCEIARLVYIAAAAHGDVVWFSPGEKHWHGAAPATAMTHIAIQEKLDGKNVDWLEKVSDEQYGG